MAINQITKSFKYTVNTILHAKFRNFLKRSLWKYMIASLLLALGSSSLNEARDLSTLNQFLIIFSCLIALSVVLMVISSYILYMKKKKDDMEITFKEGEVKVFWYSNGVKEIKSWNWIKSVEESNGLYYLDLDVMPRNVIMLAKQRLTSEENDTLHIWFTSKGKLKI
jgi:hypothetical protein